MDHLYSSAKNKLRQTVLGYMDFINDEEKPCSIGVDSIGKTSKWVYFEVMIDFDWPGLVDRYYFFSARFPVGELAEENFQIEFGNGDWRELSRASFYEWLWITELMCNGAN